MKQASLKDKIVLSDERPTFPEQTPNVIFRKDQWALGVQNGKLDDVKMVYNVRLKGNVK